DHWLFVFKKMAQLKDVPPVLSNTIWEQAFSIGKYSNLNKEDKMTYDASLKRRWDHFSTLEAALERGLKRGEEKGLKRGEERGLKRGKERGMEAAAKSIAHKLKQEGTTLDAIIRITGLPKEVIEKL